MIYLCGLHASLLSQTNRARIPLISGAARRFLRGYGVLFEWVDGDNYLFEAWALLWQLARLLILCLLADGALQMWLLCGMTAIYLLSVVVRKPRVRRIQNGLEVLATCTQLYTLTHLTLAAHVPGLPGALEDAASNVLQVRIRVAGRLTNASP